MFPWQYRLSLPKANNSRNLHDASLAALILGDHLTLVVHNTTAFNIEPTNLLATFDPGAYYTCATKHRPPAVPNQTTPAPPRCFPGSTDPRCPQPTTPEAPRCYPGSTDLRCPKPTTPAPPRCYPGSTDSRCTKPTTPAPTTPEPPKMFSQHRSPLSPANHSCYSALLPGSTDPRCRNLLHQKLQDATQAVRTNARSKTNYTSPTKMLPWKCRPKMPKTNTPKPPRCFPGSTDPRTTTPEPPRCYPGSSDPRCPKPTTPEPPKCYPGSSDPRCPKQPTPEPPRCYPGSSDPRCPNQQLPNHQMLPRQF
nr:LOW QUALITY PROTEIN: extensin-like [Maniola hyperantus]